MASVVIFVMAMVLAETHCLLGSGLIGVEGLRTVLICLRLLAAEVWGVFRKQVGLDVERLGEGQDAAQSGVGGGVGI